ncbi:MAG: response regulator [Clostridia bacterium]|nr:response regulator [Clostridia bacterium]
MIRIVYFRFRMHRYNFAVLMMPRMDGYEFTKTLRACDNNLPILMVSAKQLPVDKNKGFAVGTDDYMAKPVNQDEFLYRIKALLLYARSRISVPIQIQGWQGISRLPVYDVHS